MNRNITVPAGTTVTITTTAAVAEALPPKPVAAPATIMVALANRTMSARQLRAMGPCVKFKTQTGSLSRNRSRVWAVSGDGTRVKLTIFKRKFGWRDASSVTFTG